MGQAHHQQRGLRLLRGHRPGPAGDRGHTGKYIFHCEQIFFMHTNVRVLPPRAPEDGGRLRGGSEARARPCPAPGPRRPGSASSPGGRRSRPARTRALGWSLTRSSQTPPPTFKHMRQISLSCKPLEQKMYNKVLSLAMVDGVSVAVWRGCRPELGSAGWWIWIMEAGPVEATQELGAGTS